MFLKVAKTLNFDISGSAPNEVIMGIGSWRITPCGRAGAPSGVFTKVSTYVDWIRTTTGITN